jgi:hypothetical protein
VSGVNSQHRLRVIWAFVAAAVAVTACASSDTKPYAVASVASVEVSSVDPAEAAGTDNSFLPDIVGVVARHENSLWTFDVTVSSPYDTPQQYADGWRVLGPDGTVFGEHRLLHDHQNEQPFTRTQVGVSIPDGIELVEIEGRDQRNGYGGKRFVVALTK